MKVPDVLTNGNHKDIKLWRKEQQLKRTLNRRRDLMKSNDLKKFDCDENDKKQV